MSRSTGALGGTVAIGPRLTTHRRRCALRVASTMNDEDEPVIEPRVSEQIAGRLEGVQRAASGADSSSAWIGDGERFRVWWKGALLQLDARARCLQLVGRRDDD